MPAVAVREGMVDFWHEVRSWFHENLCEIGETEVTAAGILRVVLIRLTLAAGRQLAVVRSYYPWAIHDALVAHGIEIPFPRRDVGLLPAQREA